MILNFASYDDFALVYTGKIVDASTTVLSKTHDMFPL
jgi:hypothetical protein